MPTRTAPNQDTKWLHGGFFFLPVGTLGSNKGLLLQAIKFKISRFPIDLESGQAQFRSEFQGDEN